MNDFGDSVEIPLPTIQGLKEQGLTNNQIIQTLQRQGYTSTQIFDALSASANVVVPSSTAPPYQQSYSSQYAQQPPQGLNSAGAGARRMDQPPMPMGMQYGAPMQPMTPSFGGSETEEMIEAIIDEKWNDLLSDINKVVSWKEATDSRLAKMEQQMIDLRENFDKLQAAVVGKVGEYDQHILEVGAEVKAMEKVFSKVLPVFTDNVAELSRVADVMKRNASMGLNVKKG